MPNQHALEQTYVRRIGAGEDELSEGLKEATAETVSQIKEAFDGKSRTRVRVRSSGDTPEEE